MTTEHHHVKQGPPQLWRIRKSILLQTLKILSEQLTVTECLEIGEGHGQAANQNIHQQNYRSDSFTWITEFMKQVLPMLRSPVRPHNKPRRPITIVPKDKLDPNDSD